MLLSRSFLPACIVVLLLCGPAPSMLHASLDLQPPAPDGQAGYIFDTDYDGLKIIDYHVPKTGGRSLECTFHRQVKNGWFSPFHGKPTLSKVNTTINISHNIYNDPEQQRAWSSDPMALRVTTIRDPISRLLSVYSVSHFQSLNKRPPNIYVVSDPLFELPYNITDATRNLAAKNGYVGCKRIFHANVCGGFISPMQRGEVSFEQFATYAEAELAHNEQVRFLYQLSQTKSLGPSAAISASSMDATFDHAQRALLTHVDVVLVTERFPESIAVLNCIIKQRTGYEMEYFHRCSNYDPHESKEDLSDELRKLLEERNRYDMRLHKLANILLDKRVIEFEDEPCFKNAKRQMDRCSAELDVGMAKYKYLNTKESTVHDNVEDATLVDTLPISYQVVKFSSCNLMSPPSS